MKRPYLVIASIVALLIVVPYVVAGWEELPIDDEFREQAPGQHVTLTDGKIHYRWLGDVSGEVIVLVHGVSFPQYVFAQLADGLVDSGYRVLLFDHFGHGFSDRPSARYDVDFFDRQMIELFDQLDLVEPVHVGALSMGGVISAEFTARHPGRVKSLMLFAPAGLRLVKEEDSNFAKLLKSPVLGHWLWRILARGIYFPPEEQDAIEVVPESDETLQGDAERQADYEGYLMAMRQIFRFLPLHHRDDAFSRIAETSVPVLGVFGDADETIDLKSASLLGDLIPQAEVTLIGGGTHHLIIHRWRELHNIILLFLRHNDARRSTGFTATEPRSAQNWLAKGLSQESCSAT